MAYARVPSTLKRAKVHCTHDNYDWQELTEGYQGVWVKGEDNQKWLLVESEQGKKRDLASLERKLTKEEKRLDKLFSDFQDKRFACSTDATSDVETLRAQLKWHEIQIVADWTEAGYQIILSYQRNHQRLIPEQLKCGRFILGTNDLKLSMLEMLTNYKEQSTVERGFRFLKDQEFRLDHILLKNNNRIDALLMVMTLALLVYNLSQYRIRQRLKAENKTIPNATKKPIQNPTMRWIFLLMKGINVLYQDGKRVQICGIRECIADVISLLGEGVKKAYDMA